MVTVAREAPANARRQARASLLSRSVPNPTLSVRQFAERYVRLPKTSPFGNVPFRCHRQPYSGLLFAELESGNWKTIVVCGPSQSGKTLQAFVIPILRDVLELRLNTVAAFPEADMASDKWDTDFLPTLKDSPELQHLIPTKGPGSRSGRIKDRVSLGNGVDIKIMSRGGKDTAKAGYTSPRVYVTEAAGWSHSGEKSQEANPLRQLRARTKAFKRKDPRRCLLVEGTLTVEDELPWNARGEDDDEKFISTRSRILSPCPHCGRWISPERKDLFGWQYAVSEDEAANEAAFVCPDCSKPISEDQRQASVTECRLVHAGQSVDEHGEVVGDRPPTSTLWFHWQAWHNLLREAADFAVAEWEADQLEEGTEEHENAQKELAQFDFSEPFKSTLADHEPLKPKLIRKRTDRWKRNVIPHDTAQLTAGIDLGEFTGWPYVMAHREGGQKHVPSYGGFDVCTDKGQDVESRIVASLHEYASGTIEEGFPQEGSDGALIPGVVLIDGGWMPNAVARFIREKGGVGQQRYWLSRGRGASTKQGGYVHPPKLGGRVVMIGNQWRGDINHDRQIIEITFNADFWKLKLASMLRAKADTKGSLAFFQPEMKNEHAKVSNHHGNEQYVKRWEIGKGLVEGWVVSGDQHLNDAAVLALVAADIAGVELMSIPEVDHASTAEDTDSEEPPIGSPEWCARALAGGL